MTELEARINYLETKMEQIFELVNRTLRIVDNLEANTRRSFDALKVAAKK